MKWEREYTCDKIYSVAGVECTGEYILPDYNTDIKRVLYVGCHTVPSGGFVDGDALELCGTLAYDVVYVDAEGEIASLDFCTDYDMKIKCDSERYVDSMARVELSSYGIRLVGPRKISARASLCARAHVLLREEYLPEGDVFESYEPLTKTVGASLRTSRFSEHCEHELAEQICKLENVIADEVRVLSSECREIKNSVVQVDGGVEQKSEFLFSVLLGIDGQSPIERSVAIPLEQRIEFGDIVDGADVGVDVSVTSRRCNIVPTDDGVNIVASVIIDSRAYAFFNEDVDFVGDCYLTERDVKNDFGRFEWVEHLGVISASEKVACELPIGDDMPPIRNYPLMNASVRIDATRVENSSLVVEGQICFSGIACQVSDENALVYSAVHYDVPFSKNVNISSPTDINAEDISAECTASAVDPLAQLDEKNIYLDCTLRFDICLSGRCCDTVVVCSCATEQTYSRDESLVTVYYPMSGETLFDIAKRYHTSVERIAAVNHLDAEVLSSSDESICAADIHCLVIR